jgi:hypothetical protein
LPVDTIDPTVYDSLMKEREKAVTRLKKLKSFLPVENAPQG